MAGELWHAPRCVPRDKFQLGRSPKLNACPAKRPNPHDTSTAHLLGGDQCGLHLLAQVQHSGGLDAAGLQLFKLGLQQLQGQRGRQEGRNSASVSYIGELQLAAAWLSVHSQQSQDTHQGAQHPTAAHPTHSHQTPRACSHNQPTASQRACTASTSRDTSCLTARSLTGVGGSRSFFSTRCTSAAREPSREAHCAATAASCSPAGESPPSRVLWKKRWRGGKMALRNQPFHNADARLQGRQRARRGAWRLQAAHWCACRRA